MEDNYSGVVKVCTDESDDVSKEEQEVLKKRISGHPLYGLLMKNHINCLKVGLGELGETGDIGATNNANSKLKDSTNPSSYSDLDQFMEAYCKALNKLKEALEDPQKETASFINDMHAQLEELSGSKKSTSSSFQQQ